MSRPPATASASLPTRHGAFRVVAFSPDVAGDEHVALVKGEVAGREKVALRVHSECLTGDVLGSRRCDCRAQLEASLALIEREGCGILLYMRQEGRGIGLFNKIRAYRLQELGRDTVEANLELGFGDDQRSYQEAARLIRLLGPASVRLVTNNVHKIDGLREAGIVVEGRIPLVTDPDEHNKMYLRTKAEKLGHLLGPAAARG
ncbi:MAG TPA: GTP cyclohydrolase II [Candidatus Polarisedimenticolia bacterium]|nr:GTP cyclohydrolase II [Candidatus Polarisedimenticolia bacterium]